MREKFNKFIIIFLLLQPILDVITSLQTRGNLNYTLGTIIRGLFFLFILIYLIKKKYNKKIIILFLIYSILSLSYFMLNTENNLSSELFNIIKIFYLPFLILFFNKYENKKINDKLVTILYFIYLNLIIIPYIFGVGFTMYNEYETKKGYLGLFYGGNELCAILIGLLPVVLNFIIKSKNYLLKIIFYIEFILVTLLLGTKTMFLGAVLVFGYYLIKYFFNNFNIKKLSLLVLLIIFAGIIFIKTPVYNNIKISLDYYEINSIRDFLNINSIDKIVFSNRLYYLENVNEIYINGDKYTYLYGLGVDKIAKASEIDLFDIFYSIGIFGLVVWLIIFILSIKNIKLKNYYKFSLILFILMSLFSGHILNKPSVSIYIALLFILNKNYQETNKKRILLVSNMYPSKKYKHFGSFVKNTEILLASNGFEVDKVVKYKKIKSLTKLCSYIYFYVKTTLKGIFNNYDYIYVHFISHSTLGAIIPKITSKNTKLILNAHGNDVATDLDSEMKNIKRSKRALKYADHVIVPSNYFKKIMIENYNIDGKNITVYPSGGVDTSLFKKKDKKESKKVCGLDVNKDYIGYVGRIEKNKGYDIFLRAIKELEKRNKIENKKFLIVGSGSENSIMQELIKELNIAKYLEIRDFVSQKDLVDIYNSLDLFIFPTYLYPESLGLVGLEAMACEKIVIVSKNYGPTDYIEDKKNGFFFKPKDYKDLTQKIIEVENLNNDQKRKIIKKARETAIKYDEENTKNIILEVFK